MNKSKRLSCAKAFALFAVIPAVVWANRSGPPAGHSGAPGEPTCAACHTGTAVNPPGGSVVLTAAGGTSYVPGTAQRITVRATDTGTRIYGFQASARIASSGTVAGTFTPGAGQQVICGTAGGERDLPRPAAGCPAGTWEYIEHNQPGNGEFQFDWTPPAAASGDILISVAANSANNNNQPTGDRIFTTSLTLTPGASGGNRPAVSQGGVVNGANFSAGIQSGSWVTIFGTNFSSTALTSWNIGQDGRFPTELAGVRVNIAGKPAYIKDVVGGASGQINVQVPDDI
ncbi:MAG TPA: choice-of-anchor V domain-containing protein, partial [Bryobacteraceae bacterium]|nr:choice-of-anchor V domain-containing protein [Bryobacteraceae bacterium]